MNFTPTTAERYVCALREILQKRVTRDGFSVKTIKSVKKIYLFEMGKFSKKYSFADTFSFADNILSKFFITATAKGAAVETQISVFKSAAGNYEALAAVLGLFCGEVNKNDKVRIHFQSDGKNIKILVCGIEINKEIKKAAALADGTIFYETKEKTSLLCFPLKKIKSEELKVNFDRETQLFMIFSQG